MSQTKEEEKAERHRNHYIKNQEKIKAYRKANADRQRAYNKEYYRKYREELKADARAWTAANKERKKIADREYRIKKRKECNKRSLEYSKSTPERYLKKILRGRTYNLLSAKGFRKNKRFVEYIGITAEGLATYLEALFKPGMTWDNRGQWHVDHIIPLNSARTVEELYKLSHYTNLQPLWAAENISKGAKSTLKL